MVSSHSECLLLRLMVPFPQQKTRAALSISGNGKSVHLVKHIVVGDMMSEVLDDAHVKVFYFQRIRLQE